MNVTKQRKELIIAITILIAIIVGIYFVVDWLLYGAWVMQIREQVSAKITELRFMHILILVIVWKCFDYYTEKLKYEDDNEQK